MAYIYPMKIPAAILKTPNDIAAGLALLYSPSGLSALSLFAQDHFPIYWGELTPEEAHLHVVLVDTALAIQWLYEQSPESISLMPTIILQASAKVRQQIAPYRDILLKIADGELIGLAAKIAAGERSIELGQGVSYSLETLNQVLENEA